MSWYLDTDNRLNHADLATEGNAGFVSPYPYTFWNYISDTDKTLTLNRESATPPFIIMRYAIVDEEANRNDNQMLTYPYPASFWYLDSNNKLNLALLPDAIERGAFYKSTISEVVIPSSVKSIGAYSFSETNLTEVTLADDCTYYSTSFPPGCVVNGGTLIV